MDMVIPPVEFQDACIWGGTGFIQETIKTIDEGDPSNLARWTFPNHIGTHVDFPRHFFKNGPSIESYPPNFWHFQKIAVAHCPVSRKVKWIQNKELEAQVPNETEIILIRTDFERFRGHKRYWENNPGLAPEIAGWLRKERPSARAVGMDFISVSRWQDRERSRMAHRAFLDPKGPGKPIILVEDMSLKEINRSTIINRLLLFPLRVSGAEGAPCTVVAEVLE